MQGQPLFVIEAADTVQAQNDFIAAMTGVNKANSALDLAAVAGQARQGSVRGQGGPAEGLSTVAGHLVQAQNDMRSSQTALEAARNRLRILGLTEEAIATFQEKGRIDPNTTIYSPIAGTVVQRKSAPVNMSMPAPAIRCS